MLPLIGVTEQFDAEAPAEQESSGQALSRWEEWRDAAGQRELARTVEVMSLWMHDRNKAAERDLALIFLFFEVLVAISALVLFFIQPFPSGSLSVSYSNVTKKMLTMHIEQLLLQATILSVNRR